MNKSDIQRTLEALVEMDLQAKEKEQKLVEIDHALDLQLRQELHELELSIMKVARQEAKERYQKTMSETKNKEKTILREAELEAASLKEKVIKQLPTITDALFKELFLKS